MNSDFEKYYLYLTVFLTGAAVLVIEILGTRVLAPFYGSTIFVWTSLITITLGALAFGYFIGGRLIDKYPYVKTLFVVVAIAAFFIFLPMKIDQWVLPFTEGLGLKWGPLAATIILFAAPLFLLGMAGPMVIRLTSKDIEHSGSTAGTVFAISTVGSIFGGILSGFILIPSFSITQIFNSTSFILFIIVIFGWVFLSKTNSKRTWIFVFATIFIMVVGFYMPKYHYEDTYTLEILHQEQTHYSNLKVLEVGIVRCLSMDGGVQSCVFKERDIPAFSFINEVHRLVIEREAQSFLLLGVGAGNVFENFPSDVEITAVEIDPRTIEMGKEFFSLNDSQYKRLVIDDARHFLKNDDKKYDIIFYDIALGNVFPSHLFSVEALQTTKESLSENGLLLVHLGGGLGADDEQIGAIFRTSKEVFPTVILTTRGEYGSILLHASSDENYVFNKGDGDYRVAPIDWKQSPTLTDEHNPLDTLSFRKLSLYREEIKTIGGLRMFFAS